MNGNLYVRIIQDITKHHYNIDMICSKFYVNDVHELMDYLTHTFQESFDELIKIDYFKCLYHEFFYNITDECNNVDDLQYISISLGKQLACIKEYIKPYNKKEKQKDDMYYLLSRLKNELASNQNYVDNKTYTIYEDDNIKVMKHLIFEVKDIDALYHVISNHMEIVNIYDNDEEPLIEIVIRYYLDNIDNMPKEDIDYYKRVMTMMMIRDEFTISVDKYEELKNELSYKNTNNNHDISYVDYLLDCFLKKQVMVRPILNEIVINKDTDSRIDLRDLPTLTIDYVKYTDNIHMLFDDAFSIEELPDGTMYLYMHIPDVDEYVQRDSDLDIYMRNMCESRYIKGYKAPMIPYHIARNMSLTKERDSLSLSFRMHIDMEGNIIGMDYFKSIINVDYNMSKTKADLMFRTDTFQYRELLEKMYHICKMLRDNRHEGLGKRSRAGVIMDEYNIWSNIATAQDMYDRDIIFPYKNQLGEDDSSKYIFAVSDFLKENEIDEESRKLLYSLPETKSRTFYSTSNMGNMNFNKLPYCNVGNPLREYISLETDRLIKDLVIDDLNNHDYWEERINLDCIEQSEVSAKVKELYKTR